MRTLVFIPGNYGHNSRLFFRGEIDQRLKLAAKHDLGDIKPIDAESMYDATDWESLISTLKHYKGNFDCVVVAVDGKTITPSWNVKAIMASIMETTPGLPVVAYVDEVDPATAFRLMQSDFSLVVDRAHDERTLAMAVGRAVALRSASGRLLKIGPLGIDVTSGEVYLGENRIQLTKRESDLFLLLARRKGTVVAKDQIMSSMYDNAADMPEQKIVDVFVCKARKKLNELSVEFPILGSVIETVWGRGYRLIDYAPEELRFSIGPLTLHYNIEKRRYLTFDNKHEFDDVETVVLGFLAEAGNEPVSLQEMQKNLADADHGFKDIAALDQMLKSLVPRLANQYTGESMLRREENGDWLLYNPYFGLKAAEKRFVAVMEASTEETVDGIKFHHVENFSYVYDEGGKQLGRLSASQFKFFKYLALHKGQGFSTRDLYRVLLSPSNAMLINYAVQVRGLVQKLNKNMKKVPGFTPIHLVHNERVIGMAPTAEGVAFDVRAPAVPVAANGSDKPFTPVSRGKGTDGKPIIDEAGLFDMMAPYTTIETGKFKLQVNNKTRSSFIPTVMTSFTPPETICLLKLWYAKGEPVDGEVTVNGKPTPVADVALTITRKLSEKNPDWQNLIKASPDGRGYYFAGSAAATAVPPRPAGEAVVAAEAPVEQRRARLG